MPSTFRADALSRARDTYVTSIFGRRNIAATRGLAYWMATWGIAALRAKAE